MIELALCNNPTSPKRSAGISVPSGSIVGPRRPRRAAVRHRLLETPRSSPGVAVTSPRLEDEPGPRRVGGLQQPNQPEPQRRDLSPLQPDRGPASSPTRGRATSAPLNDSQLARSRRHLPSARGRAGATSSRRFATTQPARSAAPGSAPSRIRASRSITRTTGFVTANLDETRHGDPCAWRLGW